MAKYLGSLEEVQKASGGVLYNFRLRAEIKEDEIIPVSYKNAKSLLTESNIPLINLGFNPNKDGVLEIIQAWFNDNRLLIFDFEMSDLNPNLYSKTDPNSRWDVGYTVDAIKMISRGKIRRISSERLYYPVSDDDIKSDFTNDSVVIKLSGIGKEDEVLVQRNGIWAGPYKADYDEKTHEYYIRPNILDNKYTVFGYTTEDVQDVSINDYISYNGLSALSETLLKIKYPGNVALHDVCTDETLVKDLQSCLQNKKHIDGDGTITPDKISELLEQDKTSLFTGAPLTEEIIKNRYTRVKKFLSSSSFESIVNDFSDFIFPLIIKNKDNDIVEELIERLFSVHPELLENVKEYNAVQTRIQDKVEGLELLEEVYRNLIDDIDALKTEKEKIEHLPEIEEAKAAAILKIEEELSDKRAKIKEYEEKLGAYESLADIKEEENKCKREVDGLKKHMESINRDTKVLEQKFEKLIDSSHEKLADVAFDGYVTSKMMRTAAQWEAQEDVQQNEEVLGRIRELEVKDKNRDELIEYLCSTVQLVRPSYSRNTILDIAVCLTQDFLTVFSGEPGCGKTSICNIISEVLGLNKIAEQTALSDGAEPGAARYVPVSVERGWTSKRDFVGYYNPLSKTFDKSNRKLYDALYQLDAEKRSGISKFPFVILLDEANLSPMEYYWSDFMNICDDLGPQSRVNLGEDYVFGIPETLHFLATINNDHTTETLSPRLIDRASVIVLPYQDNMKLTDETIPSDKIEVITWTSLAQAFIPESVNSDFSGPIQKIYGEIVGTLRAQRIAVSPRVDKAVKHFWVVASKCFEEGERGAKAEIVALDYAVAQRILPKITGSGEAFRTWLEELKSICDKHGLYKSAGILTNIISHGDGQMMYYQFFF